MILNASKGIFYSYRMENLRSPVIGRGIVLLASHLGNWELGSLKAILKDRRYT